MRSTKTLELIRRLLRPIGLGTRWLVAVITAAVITAVVGAIIAKQSDGNKPAASKLAPSKSAASEPTASEPAPTKPVLLDDAPAFCTIRGIEDSGYLNAALTERSPRVAGVAVWIVDEEKWYFETAKRDGQSWSAPADSTHLWEIGQPSDPPQTSFIFAMLTRTPHTHDRLPGEEEGRRTIPHGFTIAGERIPLQQRDLLSGGYNRHC
jgi:hypothetical protein